MNKPSVKKPKLDKNLRVVKTQAILLKYPWVMGVNLGGNLIKRRTKKAIGGVTPMTPGVPEVTSSPNGP